MSTAPLVLMRRAEIAAAISAALESAGQTKPGYLQPEGSGQSHTHGATPPPDALPIAYMEEPGRRVGVLIQPGKPENQLALEELCDLVVTVANNPGGGAILLGIEAGSGQIIGTQLDIAYLERNIRRRLRLQPTISAHQVRGQRILSLQVNPSRLPLENSRGELSWRAGGATVVTDRCAWWQAHADAVDFDHMAQRAAVRLTEVRTPALQIARELRPQFHRLPDSLLLRHIGALRADGHLSAAGALLFSAAGKVAIELALDPRSQWKLDELPETLEQNTTAGAVRLRPAPELSVLEQLKLIEEALTQLMPSSGPAGDPTAVPATAYHEALLNGLVHRDWLRPEPTSVVLSRDPWQLTVHSPGGFHGGVTPQTAVSRHDAKSPALTDLFRELHLLDKQVSGINRMLYRMIFAGHKPPSLEVQPEGVGGPWVSVHFQGGTPRPGMRETVAALVPADRAYDHRLALVLWEILHSATASIDLPRTQELLHTTEHAALNALTAGEQTSVGGAPLLLRQASSNGTSWVLGPGPLTSGPHAPASTQVGT